MSAAFTDQERVQLSLRELYRGYGYLPFKVNKFEEYDLYAQHKSFLTCKQILTFSNTDGRLMALKPDVTISIVRSTTGREPLRKVYYTENVYRVIGDGDGFREIPQTGLECIGELDGYAVGEVVMLAARSLGVISDSYVLDVSHMGLVSGILSSAGVPEGEREPLLRALGARNAPELAELCRGRGMDENSAGLLRRLAGASGSPEELLPELGSLPLPPECGGALAELGELCRTLSFYGVPNVRLDFSLVCDTSYYSGIVFQGFVDGVASAVLSGGRYDPLLARMGRRGGAIGFAVYLEALESVHAAPADYDVDTLLLYCGDGDAPAAAAKARELVEMGQRVRVQRYEPTGLTYRQKLIFREGCCCE